MAYHLVNEEPIQDGVRRIAAELVDDALDRLAKMRQSEPDRDEQIHELRKRTKELRGLLRFVRTHLGKTVYRAENELLGELARGYGGAREASASLESLDKLRERFPGSRELLEGLRAPLQSRGRLDVSSEVTAERLDESVRIFEAFRARAQRWRLSCKGFAAIEPDLRRTYRQGRRAFATAQKLVTYETHHAWRKRVKDHLYHVELLLNLWPVPMKARRFELKKLGTLLGDEHDSSRFLAALHKLPFEERERLDWASIYALVQRQTRELRGEAWELGALLYAESPKRLAGRFGKYYWAVHERAVHERAVHEQTVRELRGGTRSTRAHPSVEQHARNHEPDVPSSQIPSSQGPSSQGRSNQGPSNQGGASHGSSTNGKHPTPAVRSLVEPPSR